MNLIRFLVAIQSGSPMFEVLTNVTEGRHWSAAIFACSCILIGCLSLVEAIQDSKRLVTKMSSDGLIVKQLAVKNQWAALLFNGLMSVAVQLTVSTLHLILFVNGVHLLFDSMLGLIVTYRRYCGSPFLRRTKNRSDQNVYRVLPAPEARGRDGEPAASDSDDTDIDAAVDDFKNQMYVSTVMQWNGSEELNNGQTNDGKWPPSTKVAYYLSAVCLLISILSLSVRWINYASFGVAVLSFVAYNAILFAIWNHPQRPTATNPVFRVPCVPFIPLGSTLLNCIMLFQLPAVPWMTILLWLAIGKCFSTLKIGRKQFQLISMYFDCRCGGLLWLRLQEKSFEFQSRNDKDDGQTKTAESTTKNAHSTRQYAGRHVEQHSRLPPAVLQNLKSLL